MPLSEVAAIPLPRSWPGFVKSAMLQAISLAHLAIVYARGWAAEGVNRRVRLEALLEQAQAENCPAPRGYPYQGRQDADRAGPTAAALSMRIASFAHYIPFI